MPHDPLWHCPPPHEFPQNPQFDAFVDSFTHWPEHNVSGDWHSHEPDVQTVPPWQAFPQCPQLLLSVLVSVHVLPHMVVPPVHEAAHIPFEQTAWVVPLDGQTRPQEPQLFTSDFVLIQELPHHEVVLEQQCPTEHVEG